jgi:hypothetical protein
MKRIALVLLIGGLLGAAVAFSRPSRPAPELVLRSEERNPYTSGKLNNDPDEFQFAIVSDRTGSHRAKVFSQAVARLNLLQPEFVLSVGDLIEGGRQPQKKIEAEWEELDAYVKKLQMPFFYVPGNHDVGNVTTDKVWQERYGRRHYHFVYRNVLFLILNTDDPPGSGRGHLGKEQIEDAKKILSANRGVRWTIVSMHKPVWTAPQLDKTGWLEVEKALSDRPYTVFVGHIHRYQKYVRNGRNYYQLATTGGGSRMRGVPYGEFDHIVWVTMKKDGPVFANILLDAILPDDLKAPESDEKGVAFKKLPTHPVRGTVYFDGAPAAGAYVAFTPAAGKGRGRYRADGVCEADGSFRLSAYGPFDGAPAGEYAVTVEWRKPFLTAEGRPGPNLLPARYASADSSGLTFTVKKGSNAFTINLRR